MTESGHRKPLKSPVGIAFDWSVAAVIVSWAVLGITAAWSIGSDWVSASYSIDLHQQQIADHETRLRGLESQLDTISADVRWIRRTIENGDHE